jgi:Ribbon-helix-helix protein, copG family
MRTTVRLPEELLRRAKRKAAAEGRTLTDLIEEGLRSVLARRASMGKQERVLPRISKGTGGLRPGVDLTKFSDYQEMEDLEYVERMKTFK